MKINIIDNSPHWLSAEGKTLHKRQEIRDRNRKEWIRGLEELAESKKIKPFGKFIKEK